MIKYLKENYNADYVDAITEPGPCKILAENKDTVLIGSILKRCEISINKHGSGVIAVSGHYDCAGNPCDEETQKRQIGEARKRLEGIYPGVSVIGLWVDEKWAVNEV